MTRAEAVILTDHILTFYPGSKGEREAKVKALYEAYKDYDREGVTFLIRHYIHILNKPYYPTMEELETIRLEEIRKAEQLLNDPRNPYYMQVSPEAGRRRQQKLDRAQNVIKLLRPKERPLLKE